MMKCYVGLIIILGIAIYANSLGGAFVWDDESLVEKNLYIRDISCVSDIFTKDISGYGQVSRSYRPLQILTYMFDYNLWKSDVRGFHLTNIILHILVALLLYQLISMLFNKSSLALITALLFVSHPIHTEAVTYISGRADPLSAIFMLLCLILYIKNIHKDRLSLILLSLLTYALAILSREHAIILPLIILLYHYCFKIKIRPRQFIPISLISLAYIILRLTILRYLLPHLNQETALLQRIPGVFVAIYEYIRLLILPFGLHMEYGNKIFGLTHPKIWLGLIITISLLTYSTRKKNTLLSFGILWFFIMLLPSSNLYPINTYMAEHWLYMPSIGFFLITASALERLYLRKELKMPVTIAIACIVCVLSFLTIRQNTFWQKPLEFYERTLKYAPDSARVYNNVGFLYYNMGRIEESIPVFEKAISIDANYSAGYYNLGNSYYATRRYNEAIASYNKAIERNPRYADAYNNLGNTYFAVGDYQKAIYVYNKAIELTPDNAVCYYNLANIYLNQNRFDQAIALYKKAIGLRPEYADAYNNLGNAYSRSGRAEEAISYYKRAIEINPDLVNAKKNMELARSMIKEEKE